MTLTENARRCASMATRKFIQSQNEIDLLLSPKKTSRRY